MKERSFVFFAEDEPLEQEHPLFDLSESRSELRRAFEELDTLALYTIISKMIEIFEDRPDFAGTRHRCCLQYSVYGHFASCGWRKYCGAYLRK
ncbi:hypothetical protein [Paenibacillus sp. FSL R10-2734]|uniref:hypothetical protein n=1 Tax=Paenibacillus sp. FSL R10-2734 TaxID=2954691 RepID=UPI0030DB3930